ncbi:MAG: hypothetical protein AB7P04_04265 [Bacteriovoracia bacterium]
MPSVLWFTLIAIWGGWALPAVSQAAVGCGQPAQTYLSLRLETDSNGPQTFSLHDTTGRRNLPIVSTRDPLAITQLEANVRFRKVPNGVNAEVTLRNPESMPLALGSIRISGIQLPREIKVVDVGGYANARPKRAQTSATQPFYLASEWEYPNHAYSPVQVISSDTYHFATSLLYPLLEYRHPVSVLLWWLDGRQWVMDYVLEGNLAPGETRNYEIALRVIPVNKPWIHGLRPYRDYFREKYGSVRYERDGDPVLPFMIAEPGHIDVQNNPRGFTYGPRRPDRRGWLGWSNHLREQEPLGYHRTMLWAPSGLFDRSPYNYPFQFASGMFFTPLMNATASLLRAASEATQVSLGLWWGRSTQIMRTWNPTEVTPLNLTDPSTTAAAFREMDIAYYELGAREIGLDAYCYQPPGANGVDWPCFRWLEMLRSRYPEARFITEARQSDLMHLLSPTFYFRGGQSAERWPTEPNRIADLVVPGHESWVDVSYQMSQSDRFRLAADGYTIVLFADGEPSHRKYRASRSWRKTIPSDLRECD